MKRDKLAKQLRQIEIEFGNYPENMDIRKEIYNALSDDDIIQSCQECAVCGEICVPDEDMECIIEASKDAEDFILYLQEMQEIKQQQFLDKIKASKKAVKDLGLSEFLELEENTNESENPPCHY